MRSIRLSLLACLLATLPLSAASGQESAAATQPLVIARQGNFFVGGHEAQTPDGPVIAGAMYVEYQIPAQQTHPYPLVFFHGGASSGASFWSTPDGREGWATLFLRKGYAVYVVDRPTLGRSPHYETVDGRKLMPPAGLPAREGQAAPPPPTSKPAHLPGTNAPDDPATAYMRRARQSTIEVPFGAPGDALAVSLYVDRLDREAGAALLDRIGPAILVTHSRAGTTGWQIADARPRLVKAIVAAEPNGPPFYNAPPMGAPGDPVARPFGITYAGLRFDPPVTDLRDFGPLTQLPPEDGHKVGCWTVAGKMPRLVNLAQVPVIVLVGGASYHAGYDHCTAQFLKKAGVSVDLVPLDAHGFVGNTHGFPTETNNHLIADFIARWLAERDL
ncbi:pimeloyl-ACP methyl ester carboxylesterase [Sphingobium sp. B11D3B]|uniref:alpha/beta fold hydrolase n=1 Tax=Sphingobium sp. B11D3B TaxID=2940575 RepID=UPI0022266D59|nr:alpha/beta fold hydrolase [Sphingobium sp. B11D3B]MCW2387562.1 pimeloyl-ACP methyl ester carboxylesterase [Sphingobium sp. B11D3B]